MSGSQLLSVSAQDGHPMSVSSITLIGDRAAQAPARALYSPRETESVLGISHASLYRLIAAGRLDARKLGSKTLITAESVERLIAELPRLAPRPGRRSMTGNVPLSQP